VYGRFYRRLGDRQEAEDLAQDVFLRLYRNRKRYQPRAKFSTWLYHITQNVLRNALRSRRRHPNLHLDSLAYSPAFAEQFLPDRGDMPSHHLERVELAKVVRAAISGLANRQRLALELQQFEDWSYAEVAAEMAMTPKATKSLLYRARNQLRANLASFVHMGE
jgi:RNA polymerase sigma-70 factor (ECF subfamily)